MSGIRHVVLFRWVQGTTPEQVAAVAEGLRALPGVIPGVRSYHVGTDLGLAEGTWDFAVVAEFDSTEDWRAYREHPAHRTVLEERILPIAAERASVQIDR